MLVRVVNADFYMHSPIACLDPFYSEFRGSATHQVPVLRIFGSTDTGVKTCLHIHGVFPYIYIPYDGQDGADSFMYQLAASLDKAINVSLGQTSSNVQHIFKITLVSGIPFYGYHAKHHQFLKLFFYNPLILKKACALLQNGSIMGRIFQPHEAHIPYILQFMIDYNLYGMSFVNISEVKYRNNVDLIDIPQELILPTAIQKMTTCKLEIDGLAENILNRLEVNSQSLGSNPGIQALWDDERQRRRNVGDHSLVEHCLTQNRVDIEPTATHLAYLNALKEKLKKPPRHEDSEQNLSVYPAETPKDSTKKILNASTIESHIDGSQSSNSSFLDFTITPEEQDANVSLDRDAMAFLEILEDLRGNVESDSILSQVLPEQESDDEGKEEDLSLPLPYIKSPIKSDKQNLDQNETDLDECYFDLSINIPQLDGSDDLSPKKRRRRTKVIEGHLIGVGGRSSSKEESPQVDEISSISNNSISLNQSVSTEIDSMLYADIVGMLQNASKKESISTISDLKKDLLHLVSKAEEKQSQNNDVFNAFSVKFNMKLRNRRNSTKSRQELDLNAESQNKDIVNISDSLSLITNGDESVVKDNKKCDLEINLRENDQKISSRKIQSKVDEENVESYTSKNEDLNDLNLSILSRNKQSDLVLNNHQNEQTNNNLPELEVLKICYNDKKPLLQLTKLEYDKTEVIDLSSESSLSVKNSDDNSLHMKTLPDDLSIISRQESSIGCVKKKGRGRPPKRNKKSLPFKLKPTAVTEPCSLNSTFELIPSKTTDSLNESNLFVSTSESKFADDRSDITLDVSKNEFLSLTGLTCVKKRKRKRSVQQELLLKDQRCFTSTPNLKSLEESDLLESNDIEGMNINNIVNDNIVDINESTPNKMDSKKTDSKLDLLSTSPIELYPGILTNTNKPMRTQRKIKKRRGRKPTNKTSLSNSNNQNNISMIDSQSNTKNDNENVVKVTSKRGRKRAIEKTSFETTSSPRYLTRHRTATLNLNNPNFMNSSTVNSKDCSVEEVKINPIVKDVAIIVTDIGKLLNTNLIEKNVEIPKLSEINEISILEITSSDDDSTSAINNQTEAIPDNTTRGNIGLSMPTLEVNSSITDHGNELITQSTMKSSNTSKTINNVVKEIDIFREEDRYLRDYDINKMIVRNRKRNNRLKSDKKTEILNAVSETSNSEKKLLKRKLNDEADCGVQEHLQNNLKTPSTTKKTIPITVHVPLLEDSFCKSPTSTNKINNSGFTYSTGLYPSPKFKVVESNNRPYNYLPKTNNVSTSQLKKVNNFPNTYWNGLKINKKYPVKKQIIMHSCTVLEENQKIDVNNIPLKKSYNLSQSSLFPRKSQSTHSGNYSMNGFSDFQRLVLEEFENCYEENKTVHENDITFQENILNDQCVLNENSITQLDEEINEIEKLRNEKEIKQDDNDKRSDNEKVLYEQLICNRNEEQDVRKVFNENDEIKKHSEFTKQTNKNEEEFKLPGQPKVKAEVLNKLEGTIDEMIEIINTATDSTNKLLDINRQKKPVKNIQEKFKTKIMNNDNKNTGIEQTRMKEKSPQNKPHCHVNKSDDLKKKILRFTKLPAIYKKQIKSLEVPGNVDIFKYVKKRAKHCSMRTKDNCLMESKLFGFVNGHDIDERINSPRFKHFFNGCGNIKSNVSSNKKPDTIKYPVNQYAYFDGPNDSSSSSDEDVITTATKISKPTSSQSTSKYVPLKVKYTSPTKPADKSAISRIQSQDNNSNVKALTQSTLNTTTSKHSLYKHRRKLSFTQTLGNKLNTTQMEEKLSCRLKKSKSKITNEKIYIDCDSTTSCSSNSIESDKEIIPIQLCQTNLDQDESLENDLNEIIEKSDKRMEENRSDEDINSDETLTPEKNNSILNNSPLSDDLFSPASDEITIYHKIDPAKQYDVEKRFIPLAGSSKMDPQFKKLSQISNNSSSSDVITPYQREQNTYIEDVIESVVANNSSENSETSQEDINKTKNETISSLHIATDSANEIISGKFEKLNTSILTIHKPTSQNLNKKNETSVIIIPKFNPPSREMIEKSLETYNIPEVTHQEPFYSDRNDVTGNVEVGRKVLKIPSNNVVDLPSFKTNFEGIEGQKKKTLQVLEVDNKKLSAKEILEYKLSTCKKCNVIITPGKLPPTRKEVEKWLKEKAIKKDVDEETGKEKKKIFLVNSPGRDGEESFDSLSLSPCTPIDANSTIFKIDLNNDQKSIEKNKFSNESEVTNKSEDNDNNLSNKDQFTTENLPNSVVLKSNDTVIKNLSSNTPSNSHEITGTTQNNFLVASHNLNEAKAIKENLYLTILSIEVIVITRNEYKPNPELDQIKAIIFTLYDNENITKGGFIINSLPTSPTKTKLSILKGIDSKYNLKSVNTEMELINEFLEFVKEKDPDIFVGFEIEMVSWGYLIDRGYVLGLNLTILLSRTPDVARRKRGDNEELTITGRILIDFWRLLRHEIALTSYSFENIVYHILHRRIPLYSHKDLTNWLQHPTSIYRNRVIEYYSFKTRAVLHIMDQLDLIGRTSELAKLFGIQFYEVLSRGSQFRVESMMLRLAKPLNFIPVSPNQQQRVKMRAPESLPLIMEPESKFYTDPVIVLDFQSLYPSMIIAYNYCFSTCLGRIEHLGSSSPFEFGVNQLKVSRKYLKYFLNKEKLNISPCGIAYVNKSIRLGILPRMLQEILDTRLMVKKSLKQNAGNKVLSKVLDARQLGLKLIANVTYGYTAANFSGRMPCIELGDSVVSKGRETLQRAIQLVEKTSKWGARVVYGDTDSLFVLVPGKSKETAFKIGAEIADAVTNANPSPVKLKLEKIFQPCILQTKKRYVGYMYESVDQKEPEFLAKGIETVRRDGCPASAKMLEKCLKLLFETRDVSLIKKYVLRQFTKLLSGRVSIQDLTFAKEYRGASYYRPGACVPALELAKKWTSIDKRNEPRKGERVPYVIINGPPGQPLIKLVKSPRDLLNDSSIRINALYYITKAIIPPLNRCFLLVGADLNQWFNEMPRKQHQYLPTSSSPGKNKTKRNTITQFFSTLDCAICGALTQDGLCEKCKSNPQQSGLLLHEKVRLWEQHFFNAQEICQSCCGRQDEISCISLDCPVYYRRIQTNRDLQQSGFIRQLLTMLPNLEF